jgi:hypothetical protein|nr:MAG TPA: hypothetical protein [Caudoviricetes sp.]
MEKYPTILELLESGYGKDLAQTLLDSIQCYGKALVADSVCIAEHDGDNLYNMVWLLKAILKDCCGVNVE